MSDNMIVIWLDYEDNMKIETSTSSTEFQGYGYRLKEEVVDEETGETKLEDVFYSCGDLERSNCLSVAGVSQGFASDVIIEGDFTNKEAQSLVDKQWKYAN